MLSSRLQELKSEIDKCLIDAKTGLHNAVGLLYLIDAFLTQHKRYEDNWAMITFNVNRSLLISKSRSLTQDEIDTAVAKLLKGACRRSDILSFWGDATFCILTRVFEGDDVIMFTEKILKLLKNVPVEGDTIEIKAYFAITFSTYSDTPEKFLKRSFETLQNAIESRERILIGI